MYKVYTCQFIGAEQTQYPYTYCGEPVVKGRSYCGCHLRLVYTNVATVEVDDIYVEPVEDDLYA